MRKLVLVAIVAMALTGGKLLAQTPAPTAAQLTAAIKAGQKVYTDQKCSTCHSVAGVGSKMAPLDGVGAKLTSAEIHSWMTDPDGMAAKLPVKPKIKMKKYTLNDEDLNALVAYLGSLKTVKK
ncbi:MAG TPA: cytochrome c [Vicinamibacterales bacterium]|nr:cytochrome c [Vicinamibacterales bacterium]